MVHTSKQTWHSPCTWFQGHNGRIFTWISYPHIRHFKHPNIPFLIRLRKARKQIQWKKTLVVSPSKQPTTHKNQSESEGASLTCVLGKPLRPKCVKGETSWKSHKQIHLNCEVGFPLKIFLEDLGTSALTRLFEDDGLVHGRPQREIKQRYMNVYACTRPTSAKLANTSAKFVVTFHSIKTFMVLWMIHFNQIMQIILVKTIDSLRHTGSAMLLLTVVFFATKWRHKCVCIGHFGENLAKAAKFSKFQPATLLHDRTNTKIIE